MEYVVNRISALESRAQALNLNITTLCRMAQVPKGTISRWKAGHNSPILNAFNAQIGRLEQALAAEETRLRELLTEQEKAA